jgi:hypothetical protein
MALLLAASAGLFADSALSWEKHSEGISLAITCERHLDNSVEIIWLVVHIRNDSSTPKRLLTQGADRFARFFYLDDHGKRVALQSRLHPDHPEKDIVERNPRSESVSPGQTIETSLELTTDEFASIKGHSVFCSVTVYDMDAIQNGAVVETAPKVIDGL